MVRLDLLVLLSPKARLVKCYRSDLGDITLVESFGSGISVFLDSTATKELTFLNLVIIKDIEDLLKRRHFLSSETKQVCGAGASTSRFR